MHKKLTKIVTGMAKELIAYPNAHRLANDVCYRVVRHLVSFKVGGKTRFEEQNFSLKNLVACSRYYHLRGRGLVQGDPLSPDLSSLYYGDLTATHLAAFLR